MRDSSFYNTNIMSKAYTAKKLLDLKYLILEQAAPIYVKRGLIFPVTCSSTLLHLNNAGPSSVTEIAKALDHPHQTIAQYLCKLTKLGLVDCRLDTNDKRRSEYHLTKKSKNQLTKLINYNRESALAFEGLNKDIGVDLSQVLDTSFEHLKRKSLSERMLELSTQEEIQ